MSSWIDVQRLESYNSPVMQYYPLFLTMNGLHCLVVGAGEVGCRKLADLLKCDIASVHVIDIHQPSKKLKALLEDSKVQFTQRTFQEEDVIGKTLVFATTADHILNNTIVNICIARGILCNCADNPSKSSFIVPAHTESGRVSVAFSTQGGSPALSRRIKNEIAPQIQLYSLIAEVLARLRPLLLALGNPTEYNTAIFRAIVDSSLADAINHNNREQSIRILTDILPLSLHDKIGELLYGLI